MSNGIRQCPTCYRNAVYVQEHSRWFCDNCRKYLPRDQTAPPLTNMFQSTEDELLIKTEVDKIFRKIGISGQIAAIVMIIFGVIVIVFPDLISWLIGIFLIILGIITLVGTLPERSTSPQIQPTQEYRRYPPPSD